MKQIVVILATGGTIAGIDLRSQKAKRKKNCRECLISIKKRA